MPIHDWTRVDREIHHSFHVDWAVALHNRLNCGVLPEGYYVLAEQHAGRSIADVLTLRTGRRTGEGGIPLSSLAHHGGGTAVAEAPPRVRRHHTLQGSIASRRRSLAVRHVSGHRLEGIEDPYELPAEEPMTLASYVAGPPVEVYLEHLAAGAKIPDMPLFLSAERYVNTPLEPTYEEAYRGMPAFWRDVLEGRAARGA